MTDRANGVLNGDWTIMPSDASPLPPLDIDTPISATHTVQFLPTFEIVNGTPFKAPYPLYSFTFFSTGQVPVLRANLSLSILLVTFYWSATSSPLFFFLFFSTVRQQLEIHSASLHTFHNSFILASIFTFIQSPSCGKATRSA